MNTGGGGGAYNKNVKRKPASLLLTKPAPNGVGLSAVNGKLHDHGGAVKGRVGTRGRLQLQAVLRGPPGAAGAAAPTSHAGTSSENFRGSGAGRPWSTVDRQQPNLGSQVHGRASLVQGPPARSQNNHRSDGEHGGMTGGSLYGKHGGHGVRGAGVPQSLERGATHSALPQEMFDSGRGRHPVGQAVNHDASRQRVSPDSGVREGSSANPHPNARRHVQSSGPEEPHPSQREDMHRVHSSQVHQGFQHPRGEPRTEGRVSAGAGAGAGAFTSANARASPLDGAEDLTIRVSSKLSQGLASQGERRFQRQTGHESTVNKSGGGIRGLASGQDVRTGRSSAVSPYHELSRSQGDRRGQSQKQQMPVPVQAAYTDRRVTSDTPSHDAPSREGIAGTEVSQLSPSHRPVPRRDQERGLDQGEPNRENMVEAHPTTSSTFGRGGREGVGGHSAVAGGRVPSRCDRGEKAPTPSSPSVAVSSSGPSSAQGIGFSKDGAEVPQGEAALRARLAEIEMRNKEILARVAELEEHNFDLAAAMQVVEVEASQRVQREARALQSALSFRDHQLSVAQKNHTTAMNDLNAERGKRKRDRQQMERERSDAVARSAAALTAAEAAATERIAAAEKAAARATEILRQRKSVEKLGRGNDEEADENESAPDEEGMRTRPDGRASFPNLADVILSEDTDSLLALLDVSGRVHNTRGIVSLGEGGVMLDYANRNTDSFWLRTPGAENRWRGSVSGRDAPVVESSVAPSFMSPEANRERSGVGLSLGPGNVSDALKDGGQRVESDSKSGRRVPCSTSGREHKSDVGGFRVFFTPVSSKTQRDATSGLRSWSDARPYSVAGAARARRSSAGGGPPSVGVFSDGKYATTPSPLGRWAAGRYAMDYGGRYGRGGDNSDAWGGSVEDERIASVRRLPARLFACVVELVEGGGCAGDLLDVLTAYLELVAGETDDELEILASATRLICRTLSVTPAAATAVATGGAPPPSKVGVAVEKPGPIGTSTVRGPHLFCDASTAAVDRVEESKASGSSKEEEKQDTGSSADGPTSGGGESGPGENHARDNVAVGDAERVQPGNRAGDGKRVRDGVSSPDPSCAIFVAGEPVTPEANLTTRPGASSLATSRASSGAKKVSRKGHVYSLKRGSLEGVCWAGNRREDILARRLKNELVGVFHTGAMCGCLSLVESSLQAVQSALWTRDGQDLAGWAGLLDGDSFYEVMFSDTFQSPREIGAQVLSVLIRNESLFKRLARFEDHGPDCMSAEAVSRRGSRVSIGVSACKSVATVVTEATAPPSPPDGSSRGGKRSGCGTGTEDVDKVEDAEEEEPGRTGRGESFLRRLCLGAVSTGENASFGTNVALRLAVVRLAFHACHTYGAVAARSMFGRDALGGNKMEAEGPGLVPTLVNFVRLELEGWERLKYSQMNPMLTRRFRLLKESFQLLWALAMHAPLPLRDMAEGTSVFNTMVSVVSRLYNSLDMEEVHKEAMMLLELMN